MDKKEKYELLVKQIRALIEGETDEVAVMSTVASEIHNTMGFWWTGFYRVQKGQVHEYELVVGPFQGPTACLHIPYGRGVCGTAWERGETIVVPNVEEFPGHIACSSESRSEIVVPVFSHDTDRRVVAVLDIDSEHLATFDEIDRFYLERICEMI